MLHHIPIEQLGPEGEIMARQVKTCVHCGFCLPVCPTYRLLGEEMDSPRGRIFLMKEVLENNLDLEDALPYIDKCVGCLACVPACPSGVEYGELLTPFRAHGEQQRARWPIDRMTRFLLRTTLPFPGRFRAASFFGRLARPLRAVFPEQLRTMLELIPASIPESEALPEIYPAKGPRRARVALLSGCVQQVLAPQINRATLRVLAENGAEVLIPKKQNCCGALAMHTGEAPQARTFARRNLAAFPRDVDAIITNAAGCGSGMKEYGLLFKGLPEEDDAAAFAKRVRDVSGFLAELGWNSPPPLSQPLKVAYHDACHLANAQKIREAPRRLLKSIPNLELIEIPNAELCCGSAGTYNIEQPAIARSLGEAKARNIIETGSNVVATGNIGCISQLQNHLRALGHPLPIYHTIELLDQAYRNKA